MLMTSGLRPDLRPRTANSASERKWVVCFVRGTLITRMSMSCERKLCRSFFARPENQAEGMVPLASPVPGRMKPLSCLLSGMLRGVAV